MLWDTTLAANIGYIAALFYNQNNVASMASGVTLQLEREVMKLDFITAITNIFKSTSSLILRLAISKIGQFYHVRCFFNQSIKTHVKKPNACKIKC